MFNNNLFSEMEVSPTNNDLIATLTIREKELLILLCNGSANKEMASKLNISVRTVESHRRHLMLKLNLKNIAQLIKFSITNKLIPLKDV